MRHEAFQSFDSHAAEEAARGGINNSGHGKHRQPNQDPNIPEEWTGTPGGRLVNEIRSRGYEYIREQIAQRRQGHHTHTGFETGAL